MLTRHRWNVVLLIALAVWVGALLRRTASAWQVGVPSGQTDEDVARKSAGCLTCHTPDSRTMHVSKAEIGCTDCHGGDASAKREETDARESPAFAAAKTRAHIAPRLNIWATSGNPL